MMLKTSLAVAAGVAVATLSALPSEAATVNSTTYNNTISPSAYQITGLQVGGSSFTIDFRYGTFTSIFGSSYPDYTSFGTPPNAQQSGADAIGEAIVAALNIPTDFNSVTDLNDSLKRVVSQFYLPLQVGPNGLNSNESLMSICNAGGASWAACDNPQSFSNTANQMFVQLTPENNPTAVPTPALLPGLIGMGIAAVRKRKQVAVEILDT